MVLTNSASNRTSSPAVFRISRQGRRFSCPREYRTGRKKPREHGFCVSSLLLDTVDSQKYAKDVHGRPSLLLLLAWGQEDGFRSHERRLSPSWSGGYPHK